MSDYLDTHYTRTLAERLARPTLRDHVHADVCIIGGGLAGLNTGLGLAERGKSAIVLESRRIGWAASGRNGGKALTGYAASFDKMVSRAGFERSRELYALTAKALPLIRQRIEKFDIDCDVVDGVVIAGWYDNAQALRDEAALESEQLGIRSEFVDRDIFRQWYRSPHYYDGIYYPDYFHFHPLRYARGIAAAFEGKGGRIFEDSPALRVDKTASGFKVHTAHGVVTADQIVYCGSAYMKGLEPKLANAMLKVSTYVMATNPLPREVLETAITKPYGVFDTKWVCDYYRVLPDNRILWGGGVGLGRHDLPRGMDNWLLNGLLKIYPQLAGHVSVDSVWAGTMASTVHRMPHIGQIRPGVWMCTNFGNNGLGPTTAGGEVIAKAIAEGDETYKLFEPFRFDYAGGPLGPLAAQCVYRYWKAKDVINQWKQDRRTKKNRAAKG